MQSLDPFDISLSCINGRFNPEHPNISRIHTNVNLDRGPSHWRYRTWNPTFGDISRYSISEWVGDGRYSDVFIGFQDNSVQCAIKVLKPVSTDRVRRELKILLVNQGHQNIIRVMDIVIDSHEHIPALITDFVQNSPWRVLFSSMTLLDVKYYIFRILQALSYTHANGIMHRDVKPLNILCDSPTNKVVLADWGLAEFYHPMRRYSCHVATRYYKSPEILLDYEYYDYSLDLWSVGCILLELLTLRLHVFDGGDNDKQIYAIAEVVGGQPIIDWSKKYRVNVAKSVIDKLSTYPPQQIKKMIGWGRKKFRDDNAIDLTEKLLIVDHKLRITADEALLHSFFDEIRGEQ